MEFCLILDNLEKNLATPGNAPRGDLNGVIGELVIFDDKKMFPFRPNQPEFWDWCPALVLTYKNLFARYICANYADAINPVVCSPERLSKPRDTHGLLHAQSPILN